MKGARIEGATARDHETLALATGEAGAFVVEMVRSAAGEGRDVPVTGKLTIRAFGQTQTVPFTLTGARAQVGARRRPLGGRARPGRATRAFGFQQPGGAPFDRGAAAAALAARRRRSTAPRAVRSARVT